MQYPSISFRYPGVLGKPLTQRRKDLGYSSVGAYFRGLLYEDFYQRPPHHLGLLAQAFPPKCRDEYYQNLTTESGLIIIRDWLAENSPPRSRGLGVRTTTEAAGYATA